jgi:hypothetical protein
VSSPAKLRVKVPPVTPVNSRLWESSSAVSWAWLMPESVSTSPEEPTVRVAVAAPVLDSTILASRASTRVSEPPPPVMLSLPEPPVRKSSCEVPVMVSSPPPPTRVTPPAVKPDAFRVLALVPPVRTAVWKLEIVSVLEPITSEVSVRVMLLSAVSDRVLVPVPPSRVSAPPRPEMVSSPVPPWMTFAPPSPSSTSSCAVPVRLENPEMESNSVAVPALRSTVTPMVRLEKSSVSPLWPTRLPMLVAVTPPTVTDSRSLTFQVWLPAPGPVRVLSLWPPCRLATPENCRERL